jgi:tetratricopeptide (TPR) repeat protein
MANALLATGSFDEAIAAYRETIRLRPGWGKAEYNLGMALNRAGRREEALAAFVEAERLMPGSAQTEVGLATAGVHESPHGLEEAVVHFEHALQAPDMRRPAEGHNALGVALARLGRMPEAVAHFEEALRLKPDLAEARATPRASEAGQISAPNPA